MGPDAPLPTTARRAICDASRCTVAYEIVVRGMDGRANGPRTDARALLEAWSGLDVDLLSAGLPAYVTVAPDLLGLLAELPLPAGRVVVQLDCARPLTPRAIAAARRAAAQGHRIALLHPAEAGILLEIPETVAARVDVAGLRPSEVGVALAPFVHAGVEVHAVGVATSEVFEACRVAGASGFQGSFRALGSPADAPGASTAMLTCSRLLDPDAELEQLERIIEADLHLQYRLLRYLNSAYFARRREVASAREAIAMLGEGPTRRWALMVTLGMARSSRPDGLLVDALLRGRMLEKLCTGRPGAKPDHGFAVGLFSLLEALLGLPLETALEQLPLAPPVKDALLVGAAPYGPLLARVSRYLDGDFGAAERGDELDRMDAAFLSALGWTEALRPELEGAGV